MQSKDLSKEKALIESISSMTFDTKILGYEKSLIERTSSSSVLGGKEPKETPSLPTISKEERGKKKASEAAPSLQTVVPSDVSKIMSSAFSGERSATSESLLGKEVSDSIKNQISQSGLILSSISETVKMMKESIGAATSFIKEGTERITSSFNSISKDSALLIGLTSATSDSIVKKESQPSLISEKNTSTTNILSEIERKVAEIDSVDPLKMGVTSLAENIGNSIKTVVTNLVEGGKKTTIEAPKPLVLSQASTSTTPAPSSVTSVVNQGETGDSNVGSQTNQTFLGGQQGSPSVVSLSQSTIDNLASAIIKNMTLAPFLNSGR
jgi:hypothetical protein